MKYHRLQVFNITIIFAIFFKKAFNLSEAHIANENLLIDNPLNSKHILYKTSDQQNVRELPFRQIINALETNTSPSFLLDLNKNFPKPLLMFHSPSKVFINKYLTSKPDILSILKPVIDGIKSTKTLLEPKVIRLSTVHSILPKLVIPSSSSSSSKISPLPSSSLQESTSSQSSYLQPFLPPFPFLPSPLFSLVPFRSRSIFVRPSTSSTTVLPSTSAYLPSTSLIPKQLDSNDVIKNGNIFYAIEKDEKEMQRENERSANNQNGIEKTNLEGNYKIDIFSKDHNKFKALILQLTLKGKL